jgi:ketosteroid isomerase-like protein
VLEPNGENEMTPEEEVRRAHDRFYEALNRVVKSDARTMPDAWHHTDNVSTVHPMGDWVAGWDAVLATWEELGRSISEGEVDVSDLSIFVLGDTAYTTGVEHVSFVLLGKRVEFKANTTNIYLRSEDGWKMVHHHPDKAPEAEQVIDDG